MGKAVRAFLHGVIRGVESPSDTFVVNRYRYPHASEQEAMRKDWKRVGGDIKGAMNRAENDVKAAA